MAKPPISVFPFVSTTGSTVKTPSLRGGGQALVVNQPNVIQEQGLVDEIFKSLEGDKWDAFGKSGEEIFNSLQQKRNLRAEPEASESQSRRLMNANDGPYLALGMFFGFWTLIFASIARSDAAREHVKDCLKCVSMPFVVACSPLICLCMCCAAVSRDANENRGVATVNMPPRQQRGVEVAPVEDSDSDSDSSEDHEYFARMAEATANNEARLKEQQFYRSNQEAKKYVQSFARDILENILPEGDLSNDLSKEEREALILANTEKTGIFFDQLSSLKGSEEFDRVFYEILFPLLELDVNDDVKEGLKDFFKDLHQNINGVKLTRGSKNFIYDKILKDGSSQSHPIFPERLEKFIDIFSDEIFAGLTRMQAMAQECHNMAKEDKPVPPIAKIDAGAATAVVKSGQQNNDKSA